MKNAESRQDYEQRKAKMRAYYEANKAKWKQYADTAKSKLTEADRLQSRDYQRRYYVANREQIIARTSNYQKEYSQWSKEYRAAWYQANKKQIGVRRKNHYHRVVKARLLAAKANAGFLTVTEAASMLGAKLRTFRQFVYRGQIATVRSPGGRYLVSRSEVERIRDNIKHLPQDIRIQLGFVDKETSK